MTNEDPYWEKGNWAKSYVVNNIERKREVDQKSIKEPIKASLCRLPNSGGKETEHVDRRKISN